jgi:two-component system chemotaxis response regulator CheB
MGSKKDIVVVGTSSGGVQALQRLVERLPTDFDAAMLVVLHLSASSPSYLAEILQRRTDLVVTQARDGEAVRN